jgi:hypothetical protein
VFDIRPLRHEFFVAEFFPPLFVSPSFECYISRDPQEKCPHGSAAQVKAVRMAEQGEKHILGDIFRDGSGTCHPPGKAIDRIFVFVKNSLEFCRCHTTMVTRKTHQGYGPVEKILIAILLRCLRVKTEWMS